MVGWHKLWNPVWDVSSLKHPFYALVNAAKGPFVFYKIYNIIFEHGNAVSSVYTDQLVPGKCALFQIFSTWHPNTFCPYCIYWPSTAFYWPSTTKYQSDYLRTIAVFMILFIKNLLCSTVIGLDLKSHSHSREKVQFFETRLRIILLALAWRDEIEIIIRQGGRTWQAFGGANMAMKPFVKCVITIFATNASFLRVISNFQI